MKKRASQSPGSPAFNHLNRRIYSADEDPPSTIACSDSGIPSAPVLCSCSTSSLIAEAGVEPFAPTMQAAPNPNAMAIKVKIT